MVSTSPLISKSSSLCTNTLVTLPSSPITIRITVTFIFHSFFSSLEMSRYFIPFSLSFSFTLWSAGSAKSITRQVLCFFFLLSQGLVDWMRLGDPFVSQNPRDVCASHSPGQILGCVYTICLHGQISISCTIPSGSPFPTTRVKSYTLSVLLIIIIIIVIIIIIIIYNLSFFSEVWVTESLFRTYLSILSDFNRVVVWMVSIFL